MRYRVHRDDLTSVAELVMGMPPKHEQTPGGEAVSVQVSRLT